MGKTLFCHRCRRTLDPTRAVNRGKDGYMVFYHPGCGMVEDGDGIGERWERGRRGASRRRMLPPRKADHSR